MITPNLLSMWRLVVFGFFVHLLMLYSVFDIYFVSPIHHGMTPHKSELQSHAKRLVLFVADGLRARSLYGRNMKTYAPFLSDIVEHIGFWGISHTQVPTESRPGHIALLAGFNEDPSAITRGWQTNPVDFDSVINQSTNAWCWGSPDIVNMFNKDNLPRIHLFSYNADIQDFSQKINSTTALDIWVFEKVKEFINAQNPHSCKSFCEKGNVLFLHLLGLDTAGHSIKPDSKGYVENINLVDDGIKNTVQLVENYFGDGMTTYVFTADHGMTDWGSHGDGSEDETDVPLIVWGAGVSHNSVKKDIEQIDIAPLLSSLIGINIPINSLGVVPLDVIKGSDAYKANLLLTNALQLFEQYKKKHDILQTNTYAFRPYSNSSIGDIDEYLTSINIYILVHQFEKAVNRTNTFIKFCKEGIKYYLSYYQNVLLFFVTFGFLGWIMYLFISIIMFRTLENGIHITWQQNELKNTKLVRSVIYCALVLLCILVFVLSLPMKYYIYCIFCCTWWMVAQNINKLFQSFSIIDGIHWNSFLYSAFGYIIGIEILVTSLFEREVISILLLYYFWKCCNDRYHYKDVYEWLKDVLTTGILAICPVTLQLQTVFDSRTVCLSMFLWTEKHYKIMQYQLSSKDRNIFILQFCCLYLAFANTICVNLSIINGYGLPIVNQIISWTLLVVPPILPLLMSTKLNIRLVSAIVALMTPYSLMAVGYEHLFMNIFVRLILNWSAKESLKKVKRNPMFFTFIDSRCVNSCFYLLVFLMFSYLGVGNTGSINSFDPMWVRCFVTIFSPYTMASLILLKLTIPFLIVLCGFRGVIVSINEELYNCFLILLFFCDIMVIQCLYFVKNEGSWLEIGVSLSRFIAVNITTILLIFLYQISNALITTQGTYLKACILKYLKIKLN